MALLSPRLPQTAVAPLAELADLWRQGLNRNHDPGCGCGGLFVPAINARMIEEDFLDYLHARYTKEKHADLAAFVGARRRDATHGVGANTFERWIVSIEGASLSDASRTRLVNDIQTFVDSMAGETRRGPGMCI